MKATQGTERSLAAAACAVLFFYNGLTRPAAAASAALDLTDRDAVTELVRQSEAVLYQSIERGNMEAFHRAVSKQWREHMTVAELHDAYRLLMMLSPERRYWRGRNFVMDWPVSVGEGGMFRVQIRYPAPDEHAFIEQVYLPEDGRFKLGGYHIEFRPFDADWERYNRAMIRKYEEGDHEKALEDGRRALRVAAALDPAKPRLALISAGNLAGIHGQLGQFAEALPFRFLALLIADRTYGRADVRVADQLDQMMVALYLTGRGEEAALCEAWSQAVRAAAGGDQEAGQSLEREMNLDLLKVAIPSLAPEEPAEDPKAEEAHKP